MTTEEEPPVCIKRLICPLSREVLRNPVKLSDNKLYEKEMIVQYLQNRINSKKPLISPLTREVLECVHVVNPEDNKKKPSPYSYINNETTMRDFLDEYFDDNPSFDHMRYKETINIENLLRLNLKDDKKIIQFLLNHKNAICESEKVFNSNDALMEHYRERICDVIKNSFSVENFKTVLSNTTDEIYYKIVSIICTKFPEALYDPAYGFMITNSVCDYVLDEFVELDDFTEHFVKFIRHAFVKYEDIFYDYITSSVLPILIKLKKDTKQLKYNDAIKCIISLCIDEI